MPLVYLPFEEASGSKTFFNQSNLGYYDATCTTQYGCPASVNSGYKGRGIAFSSNNQRLIFNQSATNLNFSGSHPFSLSVWVKPAASSRTDKFYIFGKTDLQADSTHGYNLYLYPNGSGGYWISFNNELMQFKYQKTLVPGTWYNLTAVADGTTLRMYVDGIEVPGINTTNLIYLGPSSSAVTLGGIMVQGNPVGMYYYTYLGSLDELYIYDRVVSSGEIVSLSRPNSPRASLPDSNCQLTASQPITLTVDANSPSASIISPANGTYHKGGRLPGHRGQRPRPDLLHPQGAGLCGRRRLPGRRRGGELGVHLGYAQPFLRRAHPARTGDRRGRAVRAVLPALSQD